MSDKKNEQAQAEKNTQEAPAPEPPPAASQEAAVPPPAEALAAQVAALQDKLLRQQAEFENSRRRLMKEKQDAIRYGNESLLEALLTIIDHFELGLQAAETAQDPKAIVQGMQMVKSQFTRFLQEQGLQEIPAVGQAFDPHLHDAVSQEETTSAAAGTILSLQRKGYKLNDRLLRPASVVVAQAPAETAAKA
jgi:molecular chaperone GrpE